MYKLYLEENQQMLVLILTFLELTLFWGTMHGEFCGLDTTFCLKDTIKF